MRFTTEPAALAKIVGMVGDWMSARRKAAATLHLVACAGGVFVDSQDTVAQIDAAVWEEGECGVSHARLTEALQRFREEANITLRADIGGLHVGDVWLPLITYRSHAEPPTAFQIFLATESGVVPSRLAEPLEQLPAA